MKPFSPASQRNQDPILEVLRDAFADRRAVLEIGSGTGQHAVHFAAALPELIWQASDRTGNLDGVAQWLDEARLPNTPAALEFDVDGSWPAGVYDAVYTANTLHIMSWAQVQRLFAGLPALLADDAVLVVYGPFNDDGRFTSPSNEAFDASLRERDPLMGIRDLGAVDALAQAAGLALVSEHAMPANNRCVVWKRVTR
jgi:cyclopropane fatty-acyl-phospholipid synthase-like methyltransferase